MKAGFAGDDAPRSVFKNVVGHPKVPQVLVGLDQKEVYVGHEAEKRRGVLKMSNPVQRGQVKDWKDITRVLHTIFFNDLQVIPEEYGILLTENPFNPVENRKLITEILFE